MGEQTLSIVDNELKIGSVLLGWTFVTVYTLGDYQRGEIERALESKTFNLVLYFGNTKFQCTPTVASVSLQDDTVSVSVAEIHLRECLKQLLTI
jgi:hypothetical protein